MCTCNLITLWKYIWSLCILDIDVNILKSNFPGVCQIYKCTSRNQHNFGFPIHYLLLTKETKEQVVIWHASRILQYLNHKVNNSCTSATIFLKYFPKVYHGKLFSSGVVFDGRTSGSLSVTFDGRMVVWSNVEFSERLGSPPSFMSWECG